MSKRSNAFRNKRLKMDLKVGDVVTLAVPMFDNLIGTRGVVYNVYPDFEDENEEGASIIFENGEYDGFSYEDQQVFLNEKNTFPYQKLPYNFTNVMKLTEDFKTEYWNVIFI